MSLQRLLTWSGDERDLVEYQSAFLHKAEARLVAAVKMCEERDAGKSACLVDVLQTVPADRVIGIGCAPQLEYLVREARVSEGETGALVQFLTESLQAELCLQDPTLQRACSRPVWTALGDRCVGAREQTQGAQIERIGEAVAVGSGIPLDLESPHHRGDLAFRFPDYANYDETDSPALVGKIGAAFELVLATGPQVARFVASFTGIIVPLRVASANRWFGSFSSSWYPRRSVVVNAHLDEMHTYDVAAALVHEAIHSLVDVSELEGRLLAVPGPNASRVRSPWTGASISLQSLLDAYFVWYGLLHFWRMIALQQDLVPLPLCDRFIERCRRGFQPAFKDVVREELVSVHPFARESIELLRVAVSQEVPAIG